MTTTGLIQRRQIGEEVDSAKAPSTIWLNNWRLPTQASLPNGRGRLHSSADFNFKEERSGYEANYPIRSRSHVPLLYVNCNGGRTRPIHGRRSHPRHVSPNSAGPFQCILGRPEN